MYQPGIKISKYESLKYYCSFNSKSWLISNIKLFIFVIFGTDSLKESQLKLLFFKNDNILIFKIHLSNYLIICMKYKLVE